MNGQASILRMLSEPCGRSGGPVLPIHRWSGEYVGFFSEGWFFDSNGRYVGWITDGTMVWRADGNWLGDLVDAHYVLRKVASTVPVRRSPPVPPVPCPPPERPMAKLPRQPRPGWIDALEDVGRLPSAGELAGQWRQGETRVIFEEGGRFRWSSGGGAKAAGSWHIHGSMLSFRVGGEPEPTTYAVLEYAGTTLTLRQISATQRTFALFLEREMV